MNSAESVVEFITEFPHLLRHIEGCLSLVQLDAEGAKGPDVFALEEAFSGRMAMERTSFAYYFDEKAGKAKETSPEDIQNTLISPLLEIRGACKEYEKKLEKKRYPSLSHACESLISATDQAIDYIEGSFSFIFFDASRSTDSSLKTISLEKEEPTCLSAHRGTILIVDDTEMNRFILSQHLGRQGHKILTAASGLEAVTLLRDQSVDLVLLDIMMPGMNGYQVLELLKSDAQLRDIPVIMLSAYEDEKSIIRCIELGAEDYLSKAFNPTFLKARIESSMEKKHLHDQEKILHAVLRESQKKLYQDLLEAAQYVTSLLPPPIEKPFSVTWRFIPSDQLGGDSFSYHFVDEKRLAVYLLDVSGHGIGAALLSVSVLNMLRNHALSDADFSDPASVLTSLNRKFRMEDQNNMFFTIWYGVFDSESRTLRYSCAGAPPAVLITRYPSGPQSEILKTPGTAIGVMDDMKYETKEKSILPDQKLYIFSDGAYEIKCKDKSVFNFDNFLALLSKTTREKASGDCRNIDFIINKLRELSVDESFEDDLSILEIDF